MKQLLPSSTRAISVFALLALPLASVCLAQGATPPVALPAVEGAAPPPSGRPDRAIQRIRTEDSGSRIDEVRVGGETQSISVQPKTGANLPSYEVRPSDGTRGGAPSPSSKDTNGLRVWNVLKF